MNAGYISAFAALAGSLIGGLTTFAAAWVTQRQQANVQWLLQEKTRRQELYQQFIEEASRLYVDALIHDRAEISPFVGLYASINKMRVVSNPGIAERADNVVRIIVDTYFLPNKTLPEVRAMMQSGGTAVNASARHIIPGCTVGLPAAATCACGTGASGGPLLCQTGQWCHYPVAKVCTQ